MKQQKLLVSRCLLGENVKYNGKNNKLPRDILDKLKAKYEFVPICPEVDGGLPTPRVACEIISFDPIKVINKLGEDKTSFFVNGALKAQQICQKYQITKALLKANSPSCSSSFVYDGSFSNTKVKANGVTVQYLQKLNLNIDFFDETKIDELL